jgi:hypothetical protein
MTTINEIKRTVTQLPPEKLAEFRKWYEMFDTEKWDDQFIEDVKTGKLDALAYESIEDAHSNKHIKYRNRHEITKTPNPTKESLHH